MSDYQLGIIDEENEDEQEETIVKNILESILEKVSRISIENESNVCAVGRQNVRDNGELRAEVRVVSVTTSATKRECVVCFEKIETYERSIQPCPCGYFIHPLCLVSGLQAYEADHPGCSPLGCRFCHTPFIITPTKNMAYTVLDKVYAKYRQFCRFGYHAITAAFIDSAFTVAGLSLLYKIYEPEDAEKLLFSMEPTKTVATCKAIPIISIAVNFIPWEMKLLGFLRRCSSLPVVGKLFPCSDPRVREPVHKRSFVGVLVGGLLLPLHANIFGVKLFGSVESRLARFILGGLAFIIIKGALQMYYIQRLYSRQCCLTVETYRGDQ